MIYEDNQACALWTENPIHHSCQKHIDIAHHAIRDWVNERHITVRYIKSADQLADMLTKALPKDVHRRMMYLVMGNNPNIVQDSQKLADILPDRLYDARADNLSAPAVG